MECAPLRDRPALRAGLPECGVSRTQTPEQERLGDPAPNHSWLGNRNSFARDALSRVNQGETPAAIKVRLDRGKLAGGMMALRESERKGDEEGEMGCRRCGQSLPRWCGVPHQGGASGLG